ncbi:MAG TPA: flagellar protein FlaG [Hydrogenothermaceae bacterium]|nr:flagellar protein FlaG [Hydrogenothermaceae bacterium]
MEIKLGQSQALTNMNSQNVELQRVIQENKQKVNNQQNQNQQTIEEVTPEKINDAINDLNKKLELLNSQLRIETDEDTGIQVIKIVDKDTKEVIRQIPPEAVLKVAKYLNEVAGLLFDSKV